MNAIEFLQVRFLEPGAWYLKHEAPNFHNDFPKALQEVYVERLRQLSLWGDNDFDGKDQNEIFLILAEEVGEIAKAILEGDAENLHEEIAQVAAVAVKWLEHLEQVGRKEVKNETLNDSLDSVFISGDVSGYNSPGVTCTQTPYHAPSYTEENLP